jgi:hypothetical protein
MAACHGARREPLITYFDSELGLSVRYPATWSSEQAQQDGSRYRYFLGPPKGPERKPALSMTLLGARFDGDLEAYAQTYLAGNTVSSSREEERPGAKGKSYAFASADGSRRHLLLLLPEGPRVYVLHAEGEAQEFARAEATLDEMAGSLTLERPAQYREVSDDRFRFALRMPPSWPETRRFTGPQTLLLQYTSPALASDPGGHTVHASLTLTVEVVADDGDIEAFYSDTRQKLGGSFLILDHKRWKGGYRDVMSAESSLSASRVKRFYRVAQGRGYGLAFEAREDVYARVSRWCELIADTLKLGTDPAVH